MLGDKNRMAAHGRLPAVVGRIGGGQALVKKLPPMIQHDRQGFFGQIRPIFSLQFETAAELAPGEGGKKIGHISH